jgi:prepilin-type processing-associated H-X9-DG protein
MRKRVSSPGGRAFTLIELLLTIAIIFLLVSLMLPAVSKGHDKVRRLRCISNLRQTGFGFLSFAHGHEDKFPMQVSTNLGGSAEFLQAGYAVNGDFYFSYRHFQPLAGELNDPKLLVCPADLRQPATNFTFLRNTNLSYFVAANPELAQPDSILSGDRNIAPVFNSIGRVGGYRYLTWTHELHRYKGNVLFADGHVEQLRDVLGQTNDSGQLEANLVMPTVAPLLASPPAVLGSGDGVPMSGTPAIQGGNLTLNLAKTNASAFGTNQGIMTNLTITSGPRQSPWSSYVIGGPDGSPPATGLTDTSSPRTPGRSPPTVALRTPEESSIEPQPQAAPETLAQAGTNLVKRGTRWVEGVPWWIVVLLLLALVWVRHRLQEKPSAKASEPKSQPAPFTFTKDH